jgi:hypothetical protein
VGLRLPNLKGWMGLTTHLRDRTKTDFRSVYYYKTTFPSAGVHGGRRMAAAATACPAPNPYCRVEARVRGPCGNEVAGFHPPAKSTSIGRPVEGYDHGCFPCLCLSCLSPRYRGVLSMGEAVEMVFSLTSTPTLVQSLPNLIPNPGARTTTTRPDPMLLLLFIQLPLPK